MTQRQEASNLRPASTRKPLRGRIGLGVAVFVLLFVVIAPFYYVVTSSFKEPQAIISAGARTKDSPRQTATPAAASRYTCP